MTPIARKGLEWCTLAVISALIASLFIYLKLPGALLLGPMVAGILVSLKGVSIKLSRNYFVFAQSIVGCMVAESISSGMVQTFTAHWPLFLFIVCSTIAATTAMGWIMCRLQILPGTTAIWGSSPGAAAAMVVMAEEFGADQRLTAFMQYLRVLIVATAASFIARLWVDPATLPATQVIVWFPALTWGMVKTVALAMICLYIARLVKIPSGSLIIPMFAGMALQSTDTMMLELPEWLLALAYALMGWRIGLGFDRDVIRHAFKALPHILASILILVGFCGGLAWLLCQHFHLDPLTAYLATSPGGMDSIAIIAASSHVDMKFVMALQSVRLFLVVLVGPLLARFVALRLQKRYA
jgi:membrane AbrB-like protein